MIDFHLYETDGVLLLDGGIGQELRRRWSVDSFSLACVEIQAREPKVVQQLHEDFIRSGARVITTNTYSTVRKRLENLTNLGSRWKELMISALESANRR